MRLLERTLVRVGIVPRRTVRDSLGAVREAFDLSDAIPARGSLAPVANTLSYAANSLGAEPYGMRAERARKLLLPKCAPIVEGDGVLFPGDREVRWVCAAIDRWSRHIEARLVRRV
ncbi:MAG: hypothetical protein GX647_06250 [Clostridiales bacterium]|nr:hypothetical protein [Clostridiales bacterium]OPZ67251.1 MAG: hypothetical protein BWY81_01401 [Firmicutes bacterium ADurb.Bin467]